MDCISGRATKANKTGRALFSWTFLSQGEFCRGSPTLSVVSSVQLPSPAANTYPFVAHLSFKKYFYLQKEKTLCVTFHFSKFLLVLTLLSNMAKHVLVHVSLSTGWIISLKPWKHICWVKGCVHLKYAFCHVSL